MRRRRAPREVTLSAADVEAVNEAALALYRLRDLASFRAQAPHVILRLIRADYCSFSQVRLDIQGRRLSALDIWESSPRRRTGLAREGYERLYFEHPFTQYAITYGIRDTLRLSDFLTLPELRRTALYRQALRPAGIGRQLSIGSLKGGDLSVITLARAETDRDFVDRECALLSAIGPHFELARTNVERESRQRADRRHSLASLGLTPREIEIALLIAEGWSNAAIANALGALVRTIEKHVENMLHKLGVENRAAVAVTVARSVRSDTAPRVEGSALERAFMRPGERRT